MLKSWISIDKERREKKHFTVVPLGLGLLRPFRPPMTSSAQLGWTSAARRSAASISSTSEAEATMAVDNHSDILKRGEVLQGATVIVVAILDFPHVDCKLKLVDAWQQGGRDVDAVLPFFRAQEHGRTHILHKK